MNGVLIRMGSEPSTDLTFPLDMSPGSFSGRIVPGVRTKSRIAHA